MNSLKVGQSFEVVEYLNGGGYSDGIIKVGGHTIKFNEHLSLANGDRPFISTDNGCFNMPSVIMFEREMKRIGKLTIIKVK